MQKYFKQYFVESNLQGTEGLSCALPGPANCGVLSPKQISTGGPANYNEGTS